MLEKAVRICDAKFGSTYRIDGDAMRLVATHNVPTAYEDVTQVFIWIAAELHQMCREPQKVEQFVSVVLQLLGKQGSAVTVANATILRGWAGIIRGNKEEGLAMLRQGLAALRATGSKYRAPYCLARAAEAHLVVGQLEDGLLLVAEASDHSGDFWLASELLTLRANSFATRVAARRLKSTWPKPPNAARGQSVRLPELRAAMSMARLWRDQSKRDETREPLAPVYGWFTEGVDTLDLKEAKALLDELAP
jgi:predicted ATPase